MHAQRRTSYPATECDRDADHQHEVEAVITYTHSITTRDSLPDPQSAPGWHSFSFSRRCSGRADHHPADELGHEAAHVRSHLVRQIDPRLNGASSLCLITLVISITCPAKIVDGKPIPNRIGFGLSVKLHSAFGVKIVNYHAPPQQGSTGMMVPSRIAVLAKVMSKSSAMNSIMGNSSRIFASANKGLFGTADVGPPTIASGKDADYIS